ncbi:MAG: PIN domain-containing protein [Acidobacteria bacterium]|nr:PIN domain-containing protein [Acidobacteriota bacterium]
MNVLVDTSVWSLALRRDAASAPDVALLARALKMGDTVLTTGLILQELLQGFEGPMASNQIMRHFAVLPFITPDVQDHVEAAKLRNLCRRKGVQVGTIDALIAQLCIRHELQLLSTDRNFKHIARHVPLVLLV